MTRERPFRTFDFCLLPSAFPGQAGFTLVELLVSMLLLLVVAGALAALVNPGTNTSLTQPEAMDMSQRARVATDVLHRALLAAGAGVDSGPSTGALVEAFAPVIPRRVGRQGADAHTVARADAITIVHVPKSAAQAELGSPAPAEAAQLAIQTMPGCPVGAAACGFAAGMFAVVFDRAGQFDIFRVTDVQGSVAAVQHLGPGSEPYLAGDRVAEVELHTYYHDTEARQLRHYDGYLTDTPVVDSVVGLEFEYYGEPQPPTRPRPPAGTVNCLYDASGVSIGGMTTLAPEGGSLSPLPLSMLADGPWCGAGANRYDADLLRVRRIRVSLRIQATQAALRAGGSDFAVPGISRSAERYLPDLVVRLDVVPRNMNLGR